MTDEQPKKLAQSEPPNPVDFPIKDPLRETYEGRWQQLPVIQKVGVIVALGSWCLFIAVLVWDDGKDNISKPSWCSPL